VLFASKHTNRFAMPFGAISADITMFASITIWLGIRRTGTSRPNRENQFPDGATGLELAMCRRDLFKAIGFDRRRLQATVLSPRTQFLRGVREKVGAFEQIAEVEGEHAFAVGGERERIEARRFEIVDGQLDPIGPTAPTARQHRVKTVDHEFAGATKV